MRIDTSSTTILGGPCDLQRTACAETENSVLAVQSLSSNVKWRQSTADIDKARRKKAMISASTVFSDDCLFTGEETCLGRWRWRTHKLVKSHGFELAICIVIVANIFYIGYETDYMARNMQASPPLLFILIQHAFSFFFFIEFILRWFSAGSFKQFLWVSRYWAWNWLDFLIVLAGVLEAVVNTINLVYKAAVQGPMSGAGNLRIMRIVRVARLLRVLRVSRVVRFLSALRTLVYSIIGTLSSLFWAIILLLLIMYSFGIIFTDAVGSHLSDRNASNDRSPADELLLTFWGTLGRSTFTLFMSIAAGVSWNEVVDPLFPLGRIWPALFIVFIAFTYFAVLNIVTANFCQSAIENAAFDQEGIIHRLAMQKKTSANLARRLFDHIDNNRSGKLSLREIVHHFEDKEVQAYFRSMELEPHDAWELFKLLDTDQGHDIDIDEFVSGCMRLRGVAKKFDLEVLVRESRLMSSHLSLFMVHMDKELGAIMKSLPGLDKRQVSDDSKVFLRQVSGDSCFVPRSAQIPGERQSSSETAAL